MLAEATDLSSLDPRHRPLPAVLDTDFIRTGLHAQLSKGMPPRSIRTVQGGSLRLFMEYDTPLETNDRLPKFADELGASVPELRRILNEDWLPHIDAVQLPAGLRELDPRALRVRDGDGVRLGDVDDFPAAALAALLSPCLLLTPQLQALRRSRRTDPHAGCGERHGRAGHQYRRGPAAGGHLHPVSAVPGRWRRHGVGNGENRPTRLGDSRRRRYCLVLQATAGTPPSYAADARAHAAGCQERRPRASQGCLRSASAKILGRIQPVR